MQDHKAWGGPYMDTLSTSSLATTSSQIHTLRNDGLCLEQSFLVLHAGAICLVYMHTLAYPRDWWCCWLIMPIFRLDWISIILSRQNCVPKMSEMLVSHLPQCETMTKELCGEGLASFSFKQEDTLCAFLWFTEQCLAHSSPTPVLIEWKSSQTA